MKKLALTMLAALPFMGGCYAYYPRRAYYYRPAARVYVAPPRPVYVAPPAVYVPPPRVRVYW